MSSEETDFTKIEDFQVFLFLSDTVVRFSIKIDDFGFEFHKISLSGIVEAS